MKASFILYSLLKLCGTEIILIENFQTDNGNQVFESGGEGNNVASVPFTVTSDVSDLAVESIQ